MTGPELDKDVARRLLCFELVRLLAARSVTHGQVGEWLGTTRASVTQAIAGKNLLSAPALEVLLRRLDALEALPRWLHLRKLAHRSPSRPTLSGPELVVGLEAYASRVELYDVACFGGLITTDRWHVLDGDDPPELLWLVEEHLTRRPQPAVFRALVRHVLGLPNVTVQVVPYGLDPALALSGGFEIVHGPAGVVVCEETRQAHHYHDTDTAIADYQAVFTTLRSAAFAPDRSRALLADT
ncbi:Scr1 family TA system antitoxin-like transcriptional regulator [Actinokineospora sp. 24-640]